jgi:PhnB protein
MTLIVTPHLNFAGQDHAALDFYAQVFGGKTVILTYGAMGQADRATSPDDVIWGQVESDDGFRIMAFDVQAGRDFDPGANAFFVSARGNSVDEVRARWDRLAEDGTILQPIGPSPWSAAYGMLTDRFGVTWILDVAPDAG